MKIGLSFFNVTLIAVGGFCLAGVVSSGGTALIIGALCLSLGCLDLGMNFGIEGTLRILRRSNPNLIET